MLVMNVTKRALRLISYIDRKKPRISYTFCSDVVIFARFKERSGRLCNTILKHREIIDQQAKRIKELEYAVAYYNVNQSFPPLQNIKLKETKIMDNCMEQDVILTGYDLLNIRNVLTSHIDTLKEGHLREDWVKLRDKITLAYDSPKFIIKEQQ